MTNGLLVTCVSMCKWVSHVSTLCVSALAFPHCVSTPLDLALLDSALKVSACGVSIPNAVEGKKKERKKKKKKRKKRVKKNEKGKK